jgi:hypothetical protein
MCEQKKVGFLAAFAQCGTVTHAAKAAKIHASTHTQWLKTDPEYRKRFLGARRESNEVLEREARRRAIEGTMRLKYHGDKPVIDPRTGEPYLELVYSDLLLIFLLKGSMPQKYRERHETKLTVQNAPNIAGADALEAARRAYNAVYGTETNAVTEAIGNGGIRNN